MKSNKKRLPYRVKNSEKCSQILSKKESGSLVIDELGSLLVMAFVFAMLLAYVAYSKQVQMKLAIDNVAKEYLYQMEQEGYLSNEMMNLMTEDLVLIGVKRESISFAGTSHMDTNQAAYGDIITLRCSVTFDNPLYTLLSVEKHSNGQEYNPQTNASGTFFTIAGLNPTITYNINMPATAKW